MTTTSPSSLTGTYRLDPARSRIGFVARQLLVARVRGAFTEFSGDVSIDAAQPGRSSAEVTMDVASLATGNARRDRHLLARFFDAVHHPRITFRSTAVEQLGRDRFRIVGGLTVRDRTRTVVVDVTRSRVATADGGVVFHGRTTLDRRDWGVTWNVALEGGGAFVSNTVVVELDVVGRADVVSGVATRS